MARQYTGTFICIECGEEWQLENKSELECEDCGGKLRAVGVIEESEREDSEVKEIE